MGASAVMATQDARHQLSRSVERDGIDWGSPVISIAASALTAVLLLGCLPTLNFWPLAWLAFVPLLGAAIAARTDARAFGLGLVTGMVFSVVALHWLVFAMRAFWGVSLATALPFFAILCLWQSVVFAALALIVRIAHRRTSLPLALLAPLTLVALEFVVPFVVPWQFAVFQAWVLPVIQIVELTGPLGVTFCLMMVNGAIHDVWTKRREGEPLPLRTMTVTASVMAVVVGFGLVRTKQIDARVADAPKMKIGIVQSNVRHDEKPQTDHAGRIDIAKAERMRAQAATRLVWSTAKLASEGAELVVWPESSYPEILPRPADPADTTMTELRARLRVPVVFGAISQHEESPFYNSAYLMDAKNRVTGRYDKRALFLLGERIPMLRRFPDLAKWLPNGSAEYAAGRQATTFELPNSPTRANTVRLGPLICLEDMIPALSNDLGRLHPNLLVSIGNDSWFGASSEAWDHLALSVFRSIEQRVGMVRATQNGASAFIDATGRVRRSLAPVDMDTTETIAPSTAVEDVALLEAGHTVYATLGSLWGVGDLIGFMAVAALGVLLGTSSRVCRPKTAAPSP